MILLTLVAPLLETSIPNDTEVAVAAFAPLPKEFGEKDRQRLAVAVRVLSDGTQDYSRRKLFDVTQGRPIQETLLPDGVLIRFLAPRENLPNALTLMDGLLRRPTIDAESLGRSLRRLQRSETGYWAAALHPERNQLRTVKVEEARALLARVFNSSRTVVAAAGGFSAGEAANRWARKTRDWKSLPDPKYPDISIAPEAADNPSGVTTVELRGKPLRVDAPSLPLRWLTLVALGVGKGSSLFRDVRQVEGWCYRQEAVLYPDREGLVPRVVAATIPSDADPGRAEHLRETLRKAVSLWTEADRRRALAMASLALEQGVPLGPLWLADAPVGGGLADRAALDAYWYAKAGVRWDPARQMRAMRSVDLEALKTDAEAFLAEAQPIVLPGR